MDRKSFPEVVERLRDAGRDPGPLNEGAVEAGNGRRQRIADVGGRGAVTAAAQLNFFHPSRVRIGSLGRHRATSQITSALSPKADTQPRTWHAR